MTGQRSGYVRDIAGQRFGALTAISFSHTDRHQKSHWNVTCDCGRRHVVAANNLRSGKTKTCGCRLENFTPRCVPVAERLLDGITMEPNTGCWLWTRTFNQKMYGTMRNGRNKTLLVHRVAYENFVGPVPEGLVLDHICRVTLCCNPRHLRPMTIYENAALGDPNKWIRERALCPNGHRYTDETTLRTEGGGRRCATCKEELRLRKNASRRARWAHARASKYSRSPRSNRGRS